MSNLQQDEVRFPERLAYGVRVSPAYQVTVLADQSGGEQRILRARHPLHKFNLARCIKNRDELNELLEFYIARNGSARIFRFKDPADFTTAADNVSAYSATDVQIYPIYGSTTIYQMGKVYVYDSYFKDRVITKPVSGEIAVAVDGVTVTTGFTIDHTNGQIEFDVAPGADAVVTIGCEFDVPVIFDTPIDDFFGMELDEQESIPDIILREVRVDDTFLIDFPTPPDEPNPVEDIDPETDCERTPLDPAQGLTLYVAGLPSAGTLFRNSGGHFITVSHDLNGPYALTATEWTTGVLKDHPVATSTLIDATTGLPIPGTTFPVKIHVQVGFVADTSEGDIDGFQFVLQTEYPGGQIYLQTGGIAGAPGDLICKACQVHQNMAVGASGNQTDRQNWGSTPEVSDFWGVRAYGIPGKVTVTQGINATKPTYDSPADDLVWGSSEAVNLYLRNSYIPGTRPNYNLEDFDDQLPEDETIEQNTSMKGGHPGWDGATITAHLPLLTGVANATEYATEWTISRRELNMTYDFGFDYSGVDGGGAGALVSHGEQTYKIWIRFIRQTHITEPDYLRIQLFVKYFLGTGDDFVIADSGEWIDEIETEWEPMRKYGDVGADTLGYHYAPMYDTANHLGNFSVWTQDWGTQL